MGPKAAATICGVSTDSLRHYEKLGLLPGVTRAANGYRRYSDESVQRVLVIQRALVVGFSLSDLRRILAIRDRGGAPCRDVRRLLVERLEAFESRLSELLALRDELRGLVKAWDRALEETAPGRPARLLESLGGRPPIERVREQRTAEAKRPGAARHLTPHARLR